MTVKIRIPSPLRSHTGGEAEVLCPGTTIESCLGELERRFPGIGARLRDEGGEVRRFVNIYVNNEDMRFLQGITTPLNDGDVVSIVPAIAGG